MVKHGLKLQNYYFFLVSNFFVCLILNKNYPAEISLPEWICLLLFFLGGGGGGESLCVFFLLLLFLFFSKCSWYPLTKDGIYPFFPQPGFVQIKLNSYPSSFIFQQGPKQASFYFFFPPVFQPG